MNIQKMMRQAQQMMEKMQTEVDAIEVEASSGGGMVKVTMSGTKEIRSLSIEAEVIDPEDPSMLEDLVLAAVNEANRKVDEEVKAKQGAMGGGLPGIPGLF